MKTGGQWENENDNNIAEQTSYIEYLNAKTYLTERMFSQGFQYPIQVSHMSEANSWI